MVLTKTTYIANDGQEFGTEQEAIDHEGAMAAKLRKAFDRWLTTANGKELLKKHESNEYGIWIVQGEDYQSLGRYEGPLVRVIERAVMLVAFWGWGGGGRIYKEEPPIKV